MKWPRTFLYAHCVVAVLCVASVVYEMSRYDEMWKFRLAVEWLLEHPGGWPAYYLLQFSCLALPIGVLGTVPNRIPAWRFWAMAFVELALGLIQFTALDLAFPIRY
jgi:hypothetical protein